jgi:hypothetical protein
MNTESLIQVINATSTGTSALLSQIAWFLAIGQAAHWLSYSLPLMLLFSVIMKVRKNLEDKTKGGLLVLVGWGLLALSVHTGTKGIAHLLQAGLSPGIYVADHSGIVNKLLPQVLKGHNND